MSKRARDETEEIIRAALREDQETKSLHKRGKVKGDKGLTLEELEELEGGTVRESRLGKAQRERAFRRKAGRAGDRPGDERNLEKFEIKTGLAEDDGQKLEPFNMAAEREEGYFDEEGHYVERNAEDGGDKDAWLTSGEAVVMSEAMRRKIEAQKQRAEDADLAPQMSKQQTADHERTIASILRPRESVLQALKRLRGAAPPKTAARKQAKLNPAQGPSSSEAPADVADLASFDKLTECASALMDSGELDVYSMLKEEFIQAADTKAPDEDMDMFGDEDAAGPTSTATSAPAASAAPTADSNPPAAPFGNTAAAGASPLPAAPSIPHRPSTQAPPVEDTTDYSSWPIKELRRFLQERGHDVTGTVEKADLVAQAVAAAAQGPEGNAADAPAGFHFDPASGYYSNPETGMYWDSTSSGFCDSSSGKWYTFDGQQYVEWPTAQPI